MAIGLRVRFRAPWTNSGPSVSGQIRPVGSAPISAAPGRFSRAENRPFVRPAWLRPYSTHCGHQGTARSRPHSEQHRRGHGWLIGMGPNREAKIEVPHSGQRKSHDKAAPCASQMARPGSAATKPHRSRGQSNQSGHDRKINQVQPVNSHALW